MFRTRISVMAAVACAMMLSPVRAATIDTFSFTQAGWEYVTFSHMSVTPLAPDPGGILSGTFTGTVEPGGFIRLADLTSFSDVYTDSADPTGAARR